MDSVRNQFDLSGKTAVITGGAGLLGVKHAEAIAELGGTPVIVDVDKKRCDLVADKIQNDHNIKSLTFSIDITNENEVISLKDSIIEKGYGIDILINNAANNPTVKSDGLQMANKSRLEEFSLDTWNNDISVGLTGALLFARTFGAQMASQRGGVILNIASDLAVISPDQRIYKKEGLKDNEQAVKPVSYSVIKTGLIGLTKYLATYWSDKGVRCNAISPGGVYIDQDKDFVKKLSNLIPLGRMANADEYKGAVAFMVSNASSYLNGANIVMDGGRSVW